MAGAFPYPSPARLRTILAALGLAALAGSLGCPGLAPERPRRDGGAQAGVATSLPLHIEGLYLTQGSQRLDQSVPLVQGRTGWLRVFVTARDWAGPAPAVRVRLRGPDGSPLLDAVVPGPAAVPRTLDQGAPGASWNLRIPGRIIVRQPTRCPIREGPFGLINH